MVKGNDIMEFECQKQSIGNKTVDSCDTSNLS